MPRFFITSTGTSIGKTLVTTSLCSQLREEGKKITALKPVISGYDASDMTNDTAQILLSCGTQPNIEEQAKISPWRYRAPLAPNMAAAKEGQLVDFDRLIDFCQGKASAEVGPLPNPPPQAGEGTRTLPSPQAAEERYMLVEGVGGVMAPVTDQHTVLDWIDALRWPVILVVGSYLGSLSHTLTAVEVLRMKNVTLQAVIISESEHSTVDLSETADTLQRFLPNGFPLVKLPRIATTVSPWKEAPPLRWICQKP